MLVHRLRRLPNIKSLQDQRTLTARQDECLAFGKVDDHFRDRNDEGI